MYYWNNREARKERAVKHTAQVAQRFRKEIQSSIENTREYFNGESFTVPYRQNTDMIVEFRQMDSVAAIRKYSAMGGKICVLDFASYNNPGGKFFEGSSAQEESLCHESFLYNVLKADSIRGRFYDKHRGASNKCLYSSHSLYVPDVVFCDSIPCDVIVCAAPNKKAAMQYNHVEAHIVNRCMTDRCADVLKIAAAEQVDVLILGAFGCGVFGNDPSLVAKSFEELLAEPYAYCFKAVVFAVPDDANGAHFRKVFGTGE